MWKTLVSRIRIVTISVAVAPLLVIHRCAFALDDLLFPSLKEVRISKPLFIVGIPRSGTTLTHRLLASQTATFTTFPLWELILAPALCEKHFLAFLRRIDRLLGNPVNGLIGWMEKRTSEKLADVHPTTLKSPEEDYLGLFVFGGCFLQVLLQPHSARVWDLVKPAGQADTIRRRRMVSYYRGLLARHLKFRGEHLTLLSKNPSFTAWVDDLAFEFPDANFIGLRRDLTESLPSQLSSMKGGFEFFGNDVTDPELVGRFQALFKQYWSLLDQSAAKYSGRFELVSYENLRARPWETVTSCLKTFDYRSSSSEYQELRQLCEQAGTYVSKHRYNLDEYGLSRAELQQDDDVPFAEQRKQADMGDLTELSRL